MQPKSENVKFDIDSKKQTQLNSHLQYIKSKNVAKIEPQELK